MLAVNERNEEVESVEMIFVKDIELSIVILNHHDLFCSEKSTKFFVEVHLLFVARRIMTHPETLRISLKTNVEHAERKDEENSNSPHGNDGSVLVIEPTEFLKYHFEVHLFYYTISTIIGHKMHESLILSLGPPPSLNTRRTTFELNELDAPLP